MGKLLKAVYFGACLALMLAMPARAYVDPSIMTFTVQIIAGVAVAVGAVAGVLWRRAKKKVQDKLGIDENAGKEVEEEIVEFEEEQE